MAAQAAQSEERSLFVFSLAGHWFAVDAENVERVIDPAQPTVLPRTPAHIAGVVPFGQEALVMLDLVRFLELDEKKRGDRFMRRIVVLSYGGMKGGVEVDQAAGVVSVLRDGLATPQVIAETRIRDFITSEYKGTHGLVGVIELKGMMEAARV